MVITFSGCWQGKVTLIWSFLKWRGFKICLIIKGLCTHMHAHTEFFLASSPELSPYSIWQGSSHHPLLFFSLVLQYCSLSAQSCNSKLQSCSSDANTDGVLPALCNFPLTLRMHTVCEGGRCTKALPRNPRESLHRFALNQVICWVWLFNKAAQYSEKTSKIHLQQILWKYTEIVKEHQCDWGGMLAELERKISDMLCHHAHCRVGLCASLST